MTELNFLKSGLDAVTRIGSAVLGVVDIRPFIRAVYLLARSRPYEVNFCPVVHTNDEHRFGVRCYP